MSFIGVLLGFIHQYGPTKITHRLQIDGLHDYSNNTQGVELPLSLNLSNRSWHVLQLQVLCQFPLLNKLLYADKNQKLVDRK